MPDAERRPPATLPAGSGARARVHLLWIQPAALDDTARQANGAILVSLHGVRHLPMQHTGSALGFTGVCQLPCGRAHPIIRHSTGPRQAGNHPSDTYAQCMNNAASASCDVTGPAPVWRHPAPRCSPAR